MFDKFTFIFLSPSLFLPALSAIFLFFFGLKLGVFGSFLIILFNLYCSFLFVSFYFLLSFTFDNIIYSKLCFWLNVGSFSITWGFLFDFLTFLTILVILIISFIVNVYSFEYMYNDPYVVRFFFFLSLFTFSMLILVSSDNFLQLFLGWEGVGICSYLLISFWNTRIAASKAAIKALIMNKIGDIFLILAISTIFYYFKTLNFASIFILYPFYLSKTFLFLNYSFNLTNVIGFFILIASMAKSAQIGLHTWLPDAMEGPTPVSAYLHSSTMVIAGVFLLLRLSPCFEFMPDILILITFIGSLTAFLGASIGMLQHDIKKVVAYSTCSQLGYMFIACGSSNYSGSFFHLINHAFFKSLLFFSAGAIIHSFYDEQDFRRMGNFLSFLPYIYISFLIGSLALSGFPFLSGFYSKDFILESLFAKYKIAFNISFWLAIISAFFTSFYSFRLIFFIFFNNTNSYKKYVEGFVEPSFFVSFSLIFLLFNSIILGYFFKDLLIGFGSNFMRNTFFLLPWHDHLIDFEFLPLIIKLLPFFFSLFSIFLIIFFYNFFLYKITFNKLIFLSYFKFLNNKWYFNNIYNFFIAKKIFFSSYDFFFLIIDQGFCDLLGFSNFTTKLAWQVDKFYINNIQNYFILFVLNFMIYLFLFIYLF